MHFRACGEVATRGRSRPHARVLSGSESCCRSGAATTVIFPLKIMVVTTAATVLLIFLSIVDTLLESTDFLFGLKFCAPTAAQSFVQLDHRCQVQAVSRRKCQFRIEQVPLGDQHVQVVREAAFVSQVREAKGRFQRVDLSLLRSRLLARSADPCQRIFNFLERCEDRLFVLGDCLPGLSCSSVLLEPETYSIQQRTGQGRAEDPEIAPGREEFGQVRIGNAEQSGEGEFWKAIGFGGPDPGRCSSQLLLGLYNIRTTL